MVKYFSVALIFLLMPSVAWADVTCIANGKSPIDGKCPPTVFNKNCPANYPFKSKLPNGNILCEDCNALWSLGGAFVRVEDDCINLEGTTSYDVNTPESKWCSKFIADMMMAKHGCAAEYQIYLDSKAKQRVDLDMATIHE